MNNDFPYLKNLSFLQQFDKIRNKQQYIKILALTYDEFIISEIQGRVTGGNISIDGSSAMRRNGNITFLVDDNNENILNIQNLLSINKKIQIFIGFANQTNEYTDYPILWFPQGIYYIISPSISYNNSSITVSLTVHDKMAGLNGQCGGIFPSSIDVNIIEQQDAEGNIYKKYLTFFDTIKAIVHEWGGQQLGKIIINDLPQKSKKVLKWTGQTPLYCVTRAATDTSGYRSTIFTTDYREYSKLVNSSMDSYYNHTLDLSVYNYGEDVAYSLTDSIIPTIITCNAGESVVSVLDKIKNMLGNYEYYYDLEGNFIFQQIKNYLNTSQSTDISKKIQEGNIEYINDYTRGKSVYSFEDSTLVQSYTNNPQYEQIKNDFIIWGIKESSSGAKIPIRYHLAIDTKPSITILAEDSTVNEYGDEIGYVPKTYNNIFSYYGEDGILKYKKIYVPQDFATYNGSTNITTIPTWTGTQHRQERQIQEGTSIITEYYYWIEYNGLPMYDKIKDIEPPYLYFLVDITYYGESEPVKTVCKYDLKTKSYIDTNYEYFQTLEVDDYRTALYLQGVESERNGVNNNYYYSELKNEWTKLYDLKNKKFYDIKQNEINYFLDFVDSEALSQFNISSIGRRTKVISNDNINCIFELTHEDIVLIPIGSETQQEDIEYCQTAGYKFCQIPENISELLVTGGVQHSAYDEIRSELYQYTTYNESISITTIPIYHLQPNTRITVKNSESCINGDYMIKSINIPLDTNGSMTISCCKALERI